VRPDDAVCTAACAVACYALRREPTMPPTLTRDALNRALLARQLLLERSDQGVARTIEHLVGLQSQLPNPPYLGLWTRLEGFDFGELAALVEGGDVVRLALMRSTIHLVSAEDAVRLRPVLEPMLDRRFRASPFARALAGADVPGVVAAARDLVAERPLSFAELGRALLERWPSLDADALAQAARAYLPLVQTPPRGVWGRSGTPRHTTIEAWLGPGHRALGRSAATASELVTRYLGAFGPASVADVQTWSGMTRLRPVLETLDLVTFEDEDGAELFDLPGAARPDPGVPAPARLLPQYDNVLLAHADRRRVLGPVDFAQLFERFHMVPGTVLLDGYVSGVWSFERSGRAVNLRVEPLSGAFSARARGAVGSEAERLLEAIGGGNVEFGRP